MASPGVEEELALSSQQCFGLASPGDCEELATALSSHQGFGLASPELGVSQSLAPSSAPSHAALPPPAHATQIGGDATPQGGDATPKTGDTTQPLSSDAMFSFGRICMIW